MRFAADLPGAIRLTRTRINRTFAALTAAVVVAAGGVAGGAIYAGRQAVLDRERAAGTRLVGAAATVAREDPAGGLLLRALALRLGGSGARAGLVADLMTNRYEGELPADARLCNEQQAWSHDGGTVATVREKSLQLWNPRTRRLVRTVSTPAAVTDCAFSPDGGTLAVAAGDDLMLLPLTSTDAGPAMVARGGVKALRYARNGLLATTGDLVRVWSPATPRAPRLRSTMALKADSWLAFSPDSRTLAVPDGGRVALLDTTRPDAIRRVASIPVRAGSAVFSPDARTLALGRSDGVTELWDTGTPAATRRRVVTSPQTRFGLVVGSVAFTPDGKRMITDGAVLGEIWAVDEAVPRYLGQVSAGPHQVTGTALSPDGRTVLVEDGGRAITLWRTSSAKAVPALARLPLDEAGVAEDGIIVWWDVTAPSRPVKLAQSSVRADAGTGPVAHSDDGKLTIATEPGVPGTLFGTSDRTRPVVAGVRPGTVASSPGDAVLDGRMLVVSTLGLVRVWDVTDPAEAIMLTEFDAEDRVGVVNGRAALSPSGVFAASQLGPVPDAYYTGVATVQLWDLAGVREIVDDPIGVACRRAGHDLPAELWRQYAPEVDPRSVCG